VSVRRQKRILVVEAPSRGNLNFKSSMKTFSAKPAEVTHEWFVIDATDKVLGRVAS